MEIVHYVEINEHGSAIVAGTRIHVEAVGFAYEGGYSEAEVLAWFSLSKEQLYGVLAYFYRHRDELIASEDEAAALARRLSQNGLEKLKARRDKQA